ncbi:glycogen debranching protein GlgX [Treponema sp.]|uniref:glycogen debranching protein GlgX n=1 Tax=Treponema sp. TaxID=166 RepID=UPI00298D9C1C|nr:glycogen debranching protein GlgX [Treponema sp.]MCR5612192.1 glycogen debranching protein GlgX [Treponema sp.]
MEALTVLEGNPDVLGATVTPRGINFAIFSRDATRVMLCFFDSATSAKPYAFAEFDPENNRTGDIWHALIPDVKPGSLYLYRIDGPHEIHRGLRFDFSKYLFDPYAKAFSEGSVYKHLASVGVIESDAMFVPDREPFDIPLFPKCVVVDDDEFNWEDDKPINRPLNESVIYEVHLKGFTASSTSGVSCPGTYKGFIEKIPYLKELGITAVELLPVYEFDENENGNTNPKNGERLYNYWGYSTIGFFAPKQGYSSDKTPGGCVREFKNLVKELHKAGIEVILDVVYNHTAEGNENGSTYEFKGIQNDVYYHLVEGDMQYYKNYTGCGNTVNCNHPVVREFIMDSLKYWVTQMHVDGFRFDLAPILCRSQTGQLLTFPPLTNQIAEDPILHDTKIIAEPWDAAGGYLVGRFPGGRWSEWNDRYRDDIRRFIRGDEFTSTAAATRLAGSSDLYLFSGRKPYNSINFITAHDGFTMNDLVSYNGKHNDENGEENRDGNDNNLSYNHGFEGECSNEKIERLRIQQIKNFMTCLFVAQGTPMFVAGDEFRRTQNGNNNAYCQDNETTWLDWNLAQKNASLVRFTKGLIAFRKAHPIFNRFHFFGETEAEKKNGVDLVWYDFDGRVPDWSKLNRFLACEIFGSRYKKEDGTTDENLYVGINTDRHDLTVILPALENGKVWARVVDTSYPDGEDITDEGKEESLLSQRRYIIPANSIVVLTSK